MRYYLAPPQQRLLQSSPNTARPFSIEEIGEIVGFVGGAAGLIGGSAGLIGGFAGLVTAKVIWDERGRQYGPVLQENLEGKILESTYPEYKQSSVYTTRKGQLDIMKIFNTMERQKTVMVCGPRGSGKTAVVRKSLGTEKMVISITDIVGENNFEQKIAHAITKSLRVHTNADVDHPELVKNALEALKNKKEYKRPPVLVVDVTERLTSPKALENLLQVLKVWGHDEGLVYPVVVLSTSHAALGLSRSMDDLRVQCTSVSDLEEDEAKRYIIDLCEKKELVGADNETVVSKCAQKVVNAIGCRPIHLDRFADDVGNLKHKKDQVSLEDLECLAVEYELKRMNESKRALQLLYKLVPKEKLKTHFFKKPEAKVDMDDFCNSVGIHLNTLLKKLSKIQPHPLYVNPDTLTVIVGSVFFQKVIDEDE